MKGIHIKFIPSIQKSSEQICQKLPQICCKFHKFCVDAKNGGEIRVWRNYILVFHMKCFSWGNWHLCLKFYWFHLNHFFFGVDYWFFCDQSFMKTTNEFYFFGGKKGRGWWFSHRQQLEQQKLSRFVMHYTTKCHIVLRKCHSKTNFMISMISASIWVCGVSLMEHWRVWRLAFCCFEGQQHDVHRLHLE